LVYFIGLFIDYKFMRAYRKTGRYALRSVSSATPTDFTVQHNRSIVHRDLKPTNILLSPDAAGKISTLVAILRTLTGQHPSFPRSLQANCM
jgi:serine/threonine protein kinase